MRYLEQEHPGVAFQITEKAPDIFKIQAPYKQFTTSFQSWYFAAPEWIDIGKRMSDGEYPTMRLKHSYDSQERAERFVKLLTQEYPDLPVKVVSETSGNGQALYYIEGDPRFIRDRLKPSYCQNQIPFVEAQRDLVRSFQSVNPNYEADAARAWEDGIISRVTCASPNNPSFLSIQIDPVHQEVIVTNAFGKRLPKQVLTEIRLQQNPNLSRADLERLSNQPLKLSFNQYDTYFGGYSLPPIETVSDACDRVNVYLGTYEGQTYASMCTDIGLVYDTNDFFQCRIDPSKQLATVTMPNSFLRSKVFGYDLSEMSGVQIVDLPDAQVAVTVSLEDFNTYRAVHNLSPIKLHSNTPYDVEMFLADSMDGELPYIIGEVPHSVQPVPVNPQAALSADWEPVTPEFLEGIIEKASPDPAVRSLLRNIVASDRFTNHPISEPCSVMIGTDLYTSEKRTHKEARPQLVYDTLKAQGFDVALSGTEDAGDLTKILVSDKGVRTPVMAPREAFKLSVSILAATEAPEAGVEPLRTAGYIWPQFHRNMCRPLSGAKFEQGEINPCVLAHLDPTVHGYLTQHQISAPDFLNQQLAIYTDQIEALFTDIYQNHMDDLKYENQDVWIKLMDEEEFSLKQTKETIRGFRSNQSADHGFHSYFRGCVGADPYQVAAARAPKAFPYASPSFDTALIFTSHSCNNIHYADMDGRVENGFYGNRLYSFVFQYEGEPGQCGTKDWGLETRASYLPVGDTDTYEVSALNNSVKRIFLSVHDNLDGKTVLLELCRDGQFASPEAEIFLKMHQMYESMPVFDARRRNHELQTLETLEADPLSRLRQDLPIAQNVDGSIYGQRIYGIVTPETVKLAPDVMSNLGMTASSGLSLGPVASPVTGPVAVNGVSAPTQWLSPEATTAAYFYAVDRNPFAPSTPLVSNTGTIGNSEMLGIQVTDPVAEIPLQRLAGDATLTGASTGPIPERRYYARIAVPEEVATNPERLNRMDVYFKERQVGTHLVSENGHSFLEFETEEAWEHFVDVFDDDAFQAHMAGAEAKTNAPKGTPKAPKEPAYHVRRAIPPEVVNNPQNLQAFQQVCSENNINIHLVTENGHAYADFKTPADWNRAVRLHLASEKGKIVGMANARAAVRPTVEVGKVGTAARTVGNAARTVGNVSRTISLLRAGGEALAWVGAGVGVSKITGDALTLQLNPDLPQAERNALVADMGREILYFTPAFPILMGEDIYQMTHYQFDEKSVAGANEFFKKNLIKFPPILNTRFRQDLCHTMNLLLDSDTASFTNDTRKWEHFKASVGFGDTLERYCEYVSEHKDEVLADGVRRQNLFKIELALSAGATPTQELLTEAIQNRLGPATTALLDVTDCPLSVGIALNSTDFILENPKENGRHLDLSALIFARVNPEEVTAEDLNQYLYQSALTPYKGSVILGRERLTAVLWVATPEKKISAENVETILNLNDSGLTDLLLNYPERLEITPALAKRIVALDPKYAKRYSAYLEAERPVNMTDVVDQETPLSSGLNPYREDPEETRSPLRYYNGKFGAIDEYYEDVYLSSNDFIRLEYDSPEAYRNHQPRRMATFGNRFDIDYTGYLSWNPEKGWEANGKEWSDPVSVVPYSQTHRVYNTTTRRWEPYRQINQQKAPIIREENNMWSVDFPIVYNPDTQRMACERFIYDENNQLICVEHSFLGDKIRPFNNSWSEVEHTTAARRIQLQRMLQNIDNSFYYAIKNGDKEAAEFLVREDPTLLSRTLTVTIDGQEVQVDPNQFAREEFLAGRNTEANGQLIMQPEMLALNVRQSADPDAALSHILLNMADDPQRQVAVVESCSKQGVQSRVLKLHQLFYGDMPTNACAQAVRELYGDDHNSLVSDSLNLLLETRNNEENNLKAAQLLRVVFENKPVNAKFLAKVLSQYTGLTEEERKKLITTVVNEFGLENPEQEVREAMAYRANSAPQTESEQKEEPVSEGSTETEAVENGQEETDASVSTADQAETEAAPVAAVTDAEQTTVAADAATEFEPADDTAAQSPLDQAEKLAEKIGDSAFLDGDPAAITADVDLLVKACADPAVLEKIGEDPKVVYALLGVWDQLLAAGKEIPQAQLDLMQKICQAHPEFSQGIQDFMGFLSHAPDIRSRLVLAPQTEPSCTAALAQAEQGDDSAATEAHTTKNRRLWRKQDGVFLLKMPMLPQNVVPIGMFNFSILRDLSVLILHHGCLFVFLRRK